MFKLVSDDEGRVDERIILSKSYKEKSWEIIFIYLDYMGDLVLLIILDRSNRDFDQKDWEVARIYDGRRHRELVKVSVWDNVVVVLQNEDIVVSTGVKGIVEHSVVYMDIISVWDQISLDYYLNMVIVVSGRDHLNRILVITQEV